MARSAAGRWNGRRSTRRRPRSRAGRGPAERRSLALGPELGAMLRRTGRMARRNIRRARSRRSFASWRSPRAAARRRSARACGRTAGSSGRSQQARARRARPPRLPDDDGWIEPIGASARAVYLFGAGHVGRALALALAPLPFAVRWIDSRREAFPAACARERRADPCPGAGRGTRRRARRRADRRHDPFACARSRDRRRGAQRRALRLRRPHRLVDQAGAVPEPDAGGRPVRGRARPPRLPDRGRRASKSRSPR